MARRFKATYVGGPSEPESLTRPRSPIATVTIGRVMGVVYGIGPLVDFPGSGWEEPIPARSLVTVTEGNIEAEVALVFEDEGQTKPLIIGLIQKPAMLDESDAGATQSSSVDVALEKSRLELSATKEIILSCGTASITLTKEGKVLINGKHVASTSSGVNRIRGASVQLN